MAEEKKKKGAAGLYGKSPRIEDEPVKAGGDTNKSGHEEGAAEKAAEPAKTEGTMNEGGNAKGDVMAGTNGVPAHHMHELHETKARHVHEHMTMHNRHARELSMGEAEPERHHKERQKMHTRHETELKEVEERIHGGGSASENGPSGGMKDKDVGGKDGTEPKD